MIEFRALGTLVLRFSNGEDVYSVLAQPKRVALLSYLAIARPLGFHRRDTLLALLWPEQDEQHARWALNQALRHLRQELGKEVVCSRGDVEVGLDPGRLWCDAVEFESAIEADEPARALELFRGALLEGFHISGCSEFERWVEEERVWLRRRAARAASALARHEEARGEPVAAGHWARRAFQLTPDDEGEARSLIELLGRVGDRAGAVQAYAEFARRLRDDYAVEPAPETRALIAAVRARQAPPASVVPGGNVPPVSEDRNGSATPMVVTTQPLATGRRRLASLALTTLLFAGIGAAAWGLWPLRSRSAAPINSSTTIAVLPFAYRGSQEFAYLGDGMVDLLSANLEGAGEIHTVEPHTVLALMRHIGDHSEPEQAHKVVARLSAGSFVLGDVHEAGGRLRISARLYALSERKQMPVSVSVQGNPAQLFQLIDGLTAQLIAARSGGPAASLSRLAALTTDSLAALKAYLEGERHFKAGWLDSSLLALDLAIRIDSSFALAHYRMATAAMWTNRRSRSGTAADQAVRYSHRLSERDRQLIEAFAASLKGRIAEAERIYRGIVTRHPDDVEANYQLGDLTFHRHAVLGRSWLDAREPFERVLSIDPKYIGALDHLSNIAARQRRMGELDSLTDRILQIGPRFGWGYRGQRAIVFGDTAGVAQFVTALRKASDDVAHPIGGFAAYTTGDLMVGRRLWRMLAEPSRSRGLRVLAHLTLAKMEVMTGRLDAAKIEIEAAKALDSATALEHRALLSLWPLLKVPRSELVALRSSLLQWKAVPSSPNETLLLAEHSPAHQYLRLYLLGLVSIRIGEHNPALIYSAELKRLSGASFAPSFVGDLARTLRAEVARARSRPGEALMILDSTQIWTHEDLQRTGNSPFFDHEYEQFARAELLYALGRYEEALQSFRSLADALFHSGGPAHLRMAQIYERQGKRREAAAHYARFVELWKDCDPELRPLVAEARKRMN